MTTLLAATLLLLAAPPEPSSPQLKELLPGIRVAEHLVEFGAEVCINAHHPDTPDVYLEMLVTAPDSREHESLLMARITPSNLHAALLAAGFEPGAPLKRNDEGERIGAHGDALLVTVATVPDNEDKEDEDVEHEFRPIVDWVVHVDEGTHLAEHERWAGLVFAGSRLTRRGYAADAEGTIISLTSFGNEVIAPTWTVSPDASVDEPVWIANRDLLPEKGTKVLVRIEPAPESHEPDGVDIDGDP